MGKYRGRRGRRISRMDDLWNRFLCIMELPSKRIQRVAVMSDRLSSTEVLWIERLTQREMDILSLLETDLSSREIAKALTIATGTVNWYIHQIYAKLGVHQRREAVRRAKELGLLSAASAGQAPSIEPSPKHNLPLQLTSFIGREKEIAEVKRLLNSTRLLTLTGPGGTGKSRLALQTAAGLVERFADGVWLVELAPLSDPALVPTTAARALSLRELTGPQVISLLQEYLEHRHLLLILDNCEHVIEACARLAEVLLRACPNLSILTSSREALGIAGEVTFLVPPLTLPEENQPLPVENLMQYEAIHLFVERAAVVQTTAVSPNFTLTPDNAPAIAQVCQRLDGIPLAIELAAARVKLLQVEEIAQRLDDRFHLLMSGSRAALPRYQTLRASIDWSYELLSVPERTLLQRLSVFAGGWVLEAAEAVGCGEGIQACDVLDLLGHLVDKSLVQTVSSTAGLSRFRILETIRQYAHEKLVETGQAEAVRHRHLQYYLELAEEVEGKLRGPEAIITMDRLELELDNIRLALAWSLEGEGRSGRSPEPGLRLAAALQWFWSLHFHAEEGFQWLERLLTCEAEQRGDQLASPARVKIRARALCVAGDMQRQFGDFHRTGVMLEESRCLFQRLGVEEKRGYALTLWVLGGSEMDRGNLSLATALEEESLALFQEVGDRFGEMECLTILGLVARSQQAYEQASKYLEASLLIHKEVGDQIGEASILYFLGNLARLQYDFEKARPFIEKSRVISSQIGDRYWLNKEIGDLGLIDWLEGNYEQAARNSGELLALGRLYGEIAYTHTGLWLLGGLALSQGDYQRADELLAENLALARKKGGKVQISERLCDFGALALAQGDLEQAASRYIEALALARETHQPIPEVMALYRLGKIEHARGELASARAHYREAIEKFPGIYWHGWNTAYALEAFAFLAVDEQQDEHAACLLGATHTWHTKTQLTRSPRERQEREDCIATLRTRVSEEAFATAWAEGQALSQEQAVAYALEELG
jgi:predicted ATPase/DNA-binding CsgD family transcriptional regulator